MPVATLEELRQKIVDLRRHLSPWRATPLTERMALVRRAAQIIRTQRIALAKLLTREQGKPIKESQPEVDNATDRLDYFADSAPKALASVDERLLHLRSVTRFQSVGVVAAIKPWNFPIGIPLWSLAPALLAGNTVLFKPSERTPLLGQRLFEILGEAGVPKGVLEIVHGADEVGREIVASNGVDMIAFVGSQAAGREIMRNSADHLRRLTLELGGKDPMIVCADADFEAAVAGAVWGTFKNCGQVCCGVERVYVERPIYDRFLEAVVEKTRGLRVGDGMDPATDVGPMNREEELLRVERHLADAVANGAKILLGGRRIRRDRWFFEPTIVTEVREDMLVFREETFGPVLSVMPVDRMEEAVRYANATPFGLTASVWSRDLSKADRIAQEIEAGTIGINQTVGSIVQCPWGGVKKSGIGRMLGPDACREFTQPVNYRFPL